jgi:hypothetical protein
LEAITWSDGACPQTNYRSNNANERTMTNKILANMTRHLTLLKFFSTFSLWLIPALLGAREPQIQVQQISADDTRLPSMKNDAVEPANDLNRLLKVMQNFGRSDLTQTGAKSRGPM